MPRFEMAAEISATQERAGEADWRGPEEEAAESGRRGGRRLFGAAYEDVTYRDSADDGVEGEMFEDRRRVATDFELVGEAERIVRPAELPHHRGPIVETVRHGLRAGRRIRSRRSVGRLARAGGRQFHGAARAAGLRASLSHPAAARHAGVVGRVRPPAKPQGNAAGRNHPGLRRDSRRGPDDPRLDGPPPAVAEPNRWERLADEVLAAVLRGDVRRRAPPLARACSQLLNEQPLLYVALGRGGNPQRIVASRGLQYVLRRLLICLPRLGLLSETCHLLETAQRHGGRPSRRARRDHRVRPRLRDRLPSHYAMLGRLFRRVGREKEGRPGSRPSRPATG